MYVKVKNAKFFLFEKYTGIPLYIGETQNEIIVTFHFGGLLVLSKIDYQEVKYLNLPELGFIEPIFVQTYNNTFLITDSSAHVVCLIDRNMHILWQFGEFSNPGFNTNLLCVPVNAFIFQNHLYISEQRNHRILKINFPNREVIHQWGINNEVGQTDGRLWAPQMTILNNELYIVMCKASRICIYKVLSNNSISLFWGMPLFSKSLFSFPRACSYSEQNKMLAVCDTYHNRICLFDSIGRLRKIIDSREGMPILWPRCVVWVEDQLVATDSTKNKLLFFTSNGEYLYSIDLSEIISTKEWIQSVSFRNDTLLIAYEKFVVIISVERKSILFNSSSLIEMNDVHQALFLQDGSVLVADTGNNRLVIFRNNQVNIITQIPYNGVKKRLKKPRMVLESNNNLFIVNSGTSQIYICDHHLTTIKHIFGNNRGLSDTRFSIPRWISPGPYGKFYISDTDNHRIVLCTLPSDK